jgi:glycosyltransferase involved in cell wall biosynthesis
MDLSVVIPVLNVGDVLVPQLDALVRQVFDGQWEVVIADNGSTDGRTLQIAEAYARIHPRLRIVDASHRKGRAAAVNAGIDAAKSDRIAVCDGDDVVGDGWAACMASALHEHRYVTGPLELQQLNKQWAVSVRSEGNQRDRPLYIHGGPCWPWAIGANLGIQRKWHDEVGGYDESFVYGGEDCDYGWKLRVKGVQLRWIPDLVVHYRVRSTYRDIYRQARGYSAALMRMQDRWGDVWPMPPSVPLPRDLIKLALQHARAMRSRAGIGFWAWTIGWSAGSRLGATQPSIGQLPPERFAPDAVSKSTAI